ncbi:hypothetical protein NKF26_19840 [Haladaptatus sp. AB618]|uniref:hypothetical protein n=1 Tax=Haladaptatus sp. AB618 TaxID=2934173 RepID=UPI00209C1843|nr:hypothetical protein [Haladaptatus sp. AB618]MCO8256065.1 hypothetical protein [Haladaptatus sp. AB618]
MKPLPSTDAESESRVKAALSDRTARYLPTVVAILLGEAVFATGLWLQTTTLDALLASGVGVWFALLSYRLFEKRET